MGHVMAHVGSRHPVTMQAHAQSQAAQCGICGRECGTGMGFHTSTSVFSCHSHPLNSTAYIIASIV